jgi:hypothetical protein
VSRTYSRKTTIPFAGFYESWHDQMLDDAFEGLFQTSNGDRRTRLEELAMWSVNWSPVHEAYAKAYTENLAEEFGLKLLFEALISPREYNFATDRIFAYIPLTEVYRLRRQVCEATFVECCIENFTSRSGFASHYDPNPQLWGPVKDWDHNQIGTLVQAYIRQANGGKDMDQSRETALMEGERDNSVLDDWVYSNLNDEGKRCVKIADYLREREDRKFRGLRL